MKSARELFEELGTDYFENTSRITIEFYNKNMDDYDYIEFDKKCKALSIRIDQFNFKKYNFDFEKLFKAINQQINELGWK